jgi:hypothetical protein
MEFKKGDVTFYKNKKYKGIAWNWIKKIQGDYAWLSFSINWIYDFNSMVVNYDPTLPFSVEKNVRVATIGDKRKLIKAILDVERINVKKKN